MPVTLAPVQLLTPSPRLSAPVSWPTLPVYTIKATFPTNQNVWWSGCLYKLDINPNVYVFLSWCIRELKTYTLQALIINVNIHVPTKDNCAWNRLLLLLHYLLVLSRPGVYLLVPGSAGHWLPAERSLLLRRLCQHLWRRSQRWAQ